jgi:23S rRNA U2552 (ribose-2'-O)-methylase RlmE/FtsJ
MDNTPHWLVPVPHQDTSPDQACTVGAAEIFLHTELHNQILAAKNEIDKIAPAGKWDDAKKITNPYEYVFLSLQRSQHRSMSAVAPLSRSYFKMLELWTVLNLSAILCPMRTAHTAEGPGGFLQAIQDRTGHTTAMTAMTLRSTERTIPGWRKSQQFLMAHPDVHITYGRDETGDLYVLDNQDAFAQSGSADIYTADGGFDFSADYNGQENTVQRLLISEAYAGLRTLKPAPTSTMIIKMFDTKHRATLQFIWLLSSCFERSGFVKPHTSRPANSERYWVGQGYRGAPDWVLALLRRLVATPAPVGWNRLFVADPWSPEWLASVLTFQEELEREQLNKIQLTLNLIKATTRDQILQLLLTNVRNSRRWCTTNRVPINMRYAALSDAEIASQNLEEALIPFQASVARTDLREVSRLQLTHHGLTGTRPLLPPAGGAWRSALPASILGREPSQKAAETPPSSAPDARRPESP